MTVHETLTWHLAGHKYAKGRYEGDAPADPARRGRTHFRVLRTNNGDMAVQFYNTHILTAKPDGTYTLMSGGFSGSKTTRAMFQYVLRVFARSYHSLHSVRRYGLSQLCLAGSRFYDGMTFSAHHELLTPSLPLQAQRLNKVCAEKLRQGIKNSGFRQMHKFLVGAMGPDAEANPTIQWLSSRHLRDIITDPDYAGSWPSVAAQYPEWAALMDAAKCGLYEIVDAP